MDLLAGQTVIRLRPGLTSKLPNRRAECGRQAGGREDKNRRRQKRRNRSNPNPFLKTGAKTGATTICGSETVWRGAGEWGGLLRWADAGMSCRCVEVGAGAGKGSAPAGLHTRTVDQRDTQPKIMQETGDRINKWIKKNNKTNTHLQYMQRVTVCVCVCVSVATAANEVLY